MREYLNEFLYLGFILLILWAVLITFVPAWAAMAMVCQIFGFIFTGLGILIALFRR